LDEHGAGQAWSTLRAHLVAALADDAPLGIDNDGAKALAGAVFEARRAGEFDRAQHVRAVGHTAGARSCCSHAGAGGGAVPCRAGSFAQRPLARVGQ
jgi:hypothetical protein